MIDVDSAIAMILSECYTLPSELVSLGRSAGRYLARDITARSDAPRFDNSSVDGYGIRISDCKTLPSTLRLVGEIHAGDGNVPSIGHGEAVRILTGAIVPSSVDAVVMQEFVNVIDGHIVLREAARLGQCVRRRGSEFRKGKRLFGAGTRVTPAVLGVLASQGIDRVRITRIPEVSILTTGNEVIPSGQKASTSGFLYDSTGPMLRARLQALGVECVRLYHSRDTLKSVTSALVRCLRSDIVITLGGVSVGDRDFVKAAMESIGIEQHFWRVSMKPGKPNFFGVRTRSGKRTLCFGLPGNPVSAAVSFMLFVEPALAAMQGGCMQRESLATLTEDIRPDRTRTEFIRVKLALNSDGWVATPVAEQGSDMLLGFAKADALARIDPGSGMCTAGSSVRVLPIGW